ncbi:MAG: GNAT family N-acetyltransferase [Cytophagales bacterium]
MKNHQKHIISTLTEAFYENASVNFVVSGKRNKRKAIRNLMNYALELTELFHGEVFSSSDARSCAVVFYKNTGHSYSKLKLIFLEIQLLLTSICLGHLFRVLNREKLKAKFYSPKPHVYIMFLGVHPYVQGQGKGTELLLQIIDKANLLQQDIYLETSNPRNIPFYIKQGFELYHTLNEAPQLFFFHKKFQVDKSSVQI